MSTSVTGLQFDASLLALSAADGWQEKNGSWWIAPEDLDVREMASLMLAQDARLITMTAMEGLDGETRLAFHWDVKGVILTFSTVTHGNTSTSISDLCIAADWVERETNEYFAVEFTGRNNTKPLMLRPGLKPGLNRRTLEPAQERPAAGKSNKL